MMKNLHLALTMHPAPRYEVAKQIDRPAPWLSAVVHEAVIANERDKQNLAKVLGKPIDTLFPEQLEKVKV